MRDARVPLKSPYIAGLLAFLIPGAGHWYQGRRFKATIFSVCILTIFVWGMILGNLQPVYSQVAFVSRGPSVQMETGRPVSRMTFGYYAQILVGVPALPALLQQERFRLDEGMARRLDGPIDSDFIGVIRERGDEHGPSAKKIQGRLELSPLRPEGSEQVKGVFRGQMDDGQQTEISIEGRIVLGRRIFGSPRREIVCRFTAPDSADGSELTLDGTIRRDFKDWFQAPRDNAELDRLHGDLSRFFDLACVFTWIAGLLNLMVIWDAVDGPAYGYGDEEPEGSDRKKEKDQGKNSDPEKDSDVEAGAGAGAVKTV
jgi:hypothetical protein